MSSGKAIPCVPPPPRMFNVWAYGSNAPLNVCEDARLREGKEWVDKPYGQTGWHWGLGFGSFSGLVGALRSQNPPAHACGNRYFSCDPLGDHEILELAINAHGASGVVDIECRSTSPNNVVPTNTSIPVLDIDSLGKYRSEFAELDRLLIRPEDLKACPTEGDAADTGVLFFMCCMTGQISAGTKFLIEVSKLLSGRDIMAIATVGFSDGSGNGQMRPGAFMAEPGMRDTPDPWPSPTQAIEAQRYAPVWHDLNALPWASRFSPHTKIARDGKIVGGAGRNM